MREMELFIAQKPNQLENPRRMIKYEPMCCHCFRSSPQLQQKERLKLCDRCGLAHYCSSCPQTHPDVCETYQIVRKDSEFLMQYHCETQNNYVITPTETPRKTYRPLSSVSSWYEYFTQMSDKGPIIQEVAPNLSPTLLPPLSDSSEDHMLNRVVGMLRNSTSVLTMPLTILAALETCYVDIASKETLKLHFIGASAYELECLMIFEELLHLLPSLKSLQLTFVGPDIPPNAVPADGKPLEMGCCSDCIAAGRSRTLLPQRGKYHEVMANNTNIPDLAVAFNTGFSQEMIDEWRPTIQALSNARHPTLFTSYNEGEIKGEIEILNTMDAKFFRSGELNKWQAMCPIIEVLETNTSPVYHLNEYWYIIGPKVLKA